VGAGLLAALLGGVNALSYYLYREARAIVAGGLSARLEAVGRGALAAMALPALRDPDRLRRYLGDLRREAGLENVFVFDRTLRSLADARPAIPAGARYDLLQLDRQAARAAAAGKTRVAEQYQVEGLRFLGAYFPAADVAPGAVLYLESTVEYLRPLEELRAALLATAGLSVALAGVLAALWFFAQRALARARAAAARAQHLAILGEMAAKVAHEIRNPLAIIRGSAELLAEEAGEPGARRSAVILDEVSRLDHLVGDFLSLARESPLVVAPFDLVSLVRETVERFAAAGAGGTRVRLDDLPDSLVVRGDAARLRQALVNLLRNGCDASPGGTVEVSVRRDGTRAAVQVRDDGPGVPPGLREHLFEPFFSTKEGGTGLGLAVARQILERHGGTLNLVPGGGRGAAFEMRLPVG
jgi:signal transduction histidine kinase